MTGSADRMLSRALLLLACVAPSFVSGCRCNDETLAPVVFDENEGPGSIDPNHVLAPPWQPPTVTLLDNGAVLHWLTEPANPAFHLRVLLPTNIHGDKLTAAGTATVLEALDLRLAARLRRIEDATYDLRSRPGRVELAVHGRDRDAEQLIELVAGALADTGDPKLLAVAQGKVLARQRDAGAEALAGAGLISALLQHPIEHEYISKASLSELSKGRLERAWSMLSHPRDAVIVVHSGRTSEQLGEAVALLGTRWKSGALALGGGKPAVTARLRAEPPKKRAQTWLFGDAAPAPLRVLGGAEPDKRGRGVVMIGRIIPTATAEERMLARLTQRLLQEEIDARLIIAGSISVLAIRVQLSPTDPLGNIERTIEQLREFVSTTPPETRLRQAASLWLGARVVEASLEGEDWTALWSESIDLSAQDREIFGALARDAQAMLLVEPEQVQAFHAKWLDPRGGEAGWVWVAAGLTPDVRAKLGAKIQIED